jgi:hypothetical protein
MTITLDPEETGYLLGLLKEHLEYHRLLAGSSKCSQKSRDRHRFLETLSSKLLERS